MEDVKQTHTKQGSSVFQTVLIALLAFALGFVIANYTISQRQWDAYQQDMQITYSKLQADMDVLGQRVEAVMTAAGIELRDFVQDTGEAIDEAADEYD